MTGILKKQKTEKKMSVRYFEGLNLWILAAVFVANIFFQLSEVSSSLFLYLGTFVMIGTLFFLDKDDYIYVTVALFSVLRFSQIFNVSVINVITVVYFFKTYVFENRYKVGKKKNQLPRNVVIAGTVFVLFALLCLLDSFATMFINIKLLLFLVYMVDVFRNMEDIKKAEKKFMNIQVYYVTGVLIAILVAIMINPEYSKEATRMSLSDGATNQLGISLASCLAFVTLGMTKVTNIKEWFVLAITALPLLFFCFETQSRTSIIGLIFIFASTIILGMSQKKSRPWIIMMAVVSVVVLGGLILFSEGTQLHENIMATFERFMNPKNNDISNGRFDLWKTYIEKLLKDYRLFFIGGTIEDFGGVQAHNMLIEIFAGYGLIGTIIIFFIYTTVFLEIRNAVKLLGKRKIKLLSFIPFVLVFIVGMASHTLLNTEPTANFCLGTAMIYFYGEREEAKNDLNDNKKQSGDLNSKHRKRKTFRVMRLQGRWI